MSTVSSSGIYTPQTGDNTDLANHWSSQNASLDTMVVPRFTSTTARDTAFALRPFKMCVVGASMDAGTWYVRQSGSWYVMGPAGQVPSSALSIPSGVDLNTYTTPGLYYQPTTAGAVAGSNYPVAVAGCLEVLRNVPPGCTQRYTVYGSAGANSNAIFVRGLYSGTWSPWVNAVNSGSQTYTPVVTGSTTNPSGYTATGRYLQTGKIFVARFVIVFGSSVGSGVYSVSLPVTPNAAWGDRTNYLVHGTGFVVVGGSGWPLWWRMGTTSGVVEALYQTNLTGGTNTVHNTMPATIVSGSTLSGQVTYEAA